MDVGPRFTIMLVAISHDHGSHYIQYYLSIPIIRFRAGEKHLLVILNCKGSAYCTRLTSKIEVQMLEDFDPSVVCHVAGFLKHCGVLTEW